MSKLLQLVAENNRVLLKSGHIDYLPSTHKIEVNTDYLKTVKKMPFKNSIVLLDGTTTDGIKRFIGKRVAALNFANAHNPGGGYLMGAMAQEEDLCREAPILYAALDSVKNLFYPLNDYNRGYFNSYHRILYTKDVEFWRDGKEYKLFCKKNRFRADVITAAAPNINLHYGDDNKDMYGYNRDKIYEILLTAFLTPKLVTRNETIVGMKNEIKDVDTIILGAWGCGAFGNNPELIAGIFKDIIRDYGGYYTNICFAIPKSMDGKNYDVFKKIISI